MPIFVMTGLTGIGVCWSMFSFGAAIAVCAGFYMPMWLTGGFIAYAQNGTAVTFGSFRRCGFLKQAVHGLKLTNQCGRYKNFEDIPSVYWQVATMTVGIGAALALLAAFISLPGCCVKDVISRTTAKMLGGFQIISAFLNLTGIGVYPLGWDAVQVKEACGETAGRYLLGKCAIGWSFWAILCGSFMLFICGSFSSKAGKPLEWQRLKANEASGSSGASSIRTVQTTSPITV